MLYPSINDLRKKVDSKYTLVIMTSKRARRIIDGSEPMVPVTIDKPVTIAVKEISEDLITYTRDDSELKEKIEEA